MDYIEITPEANGDSPRLDPFRDKVALASPLLLPSDFKQSQFKRYKLRILDEDIVIDLYGNGGRVLTLNTSEFYNSKHYKVNWLKNEYDKTILWQIRQHKVNYGVNIINAVMAEQSAEGSVVRRNLERLVYFDEEPTVEKGSRDYEESFKGRPELSFDGSKSWILRAYSHPRDKVGSAHWFREEEIREVAKLFLDKERFHITLALINPTLSKELSAKK